MLGVSKRGFSGLPGGNRSTDSWQDETNADKFGNTSAEAVAFAQTGMENIIFDEKHDFGDKYYTSYFLDINDDKMRLQGGDSQHQMSFDLGDMVRSTGAK